MESAKALQISDNPNHVIKIDLNANHPPMNRFHTVTRGTRWSTLKITHRTMVAGWQISSRVSKPAIHSAACTELGSVFKRATKKQRGNRKEVREHAGVFRFFPFFDSLLSRPIPFARGVVQSQRVVHTGAKKGVRNRRNECKMRHKAMSVGRNGVVESSLPADFLDSESEDRVGKLKALWTPSPDLSISRSRFGTIWSGSSWHYLRRIGRSG